MAAAGVAVVAVVVAEAAHLQSGLLWDRGDTLCRRNQDIHIGDRNIACKCTQLPAWHHILLSRLLCRIYSHIQQFSVFWILELEEKVVKYG